MKRSTRIAAFVVALAVCALVGVGALHLVAVAVPPGGGGGNGIQFSDLSLSLDENGQVPVQGDYIARGQPFWVRLTVWDPDPLGDPEPDMDRIQWVKWYGRKQNPDGTWPNWDFNTPIWTHNWPADSNPTDDHYESNLAQAITEDGVYEYCAKADDKPGRTNDPISPPSGTKQVKILGVDYVVVRPNSNPELIDITQQPPTKQFTGYAYNFGDDGLRYYDELGNAIEGRLNDDILLGAKFRWEVFPHVFDPYGTVNPVVGPSTTFTALREGQCWVVATEPVSEHYGYAAVDIYETEPHGDPPEDSLVEIRELDASEPPGYIFMGHDYKFRCFLVPWNPGTYEWTVSEHCVELVAGEHDSIVTIRGKDLCIESWISVTFTPSNDTDPGSDTYEFETLGIDLIFQGLDETEEEAEGGWLAVNNDYDEQNHDAQGALVPDNQPDQVEGHRIVDTDDELESLTVQVTHSTLFEGNLHWRLIFPDKVRIWNPTPAGYVEVVSEKEYDVDGTWSETVLPPFRLTRTFKVEGISASGSARDISITGKLTATGAGRTSDWHMDTVKMSCVEVDLDIDSDNDNADGAPQRDSTEENIEDISGDPDKPGKFIGVNDDDDDNDGIPDFADGYNWDGTAGNADDATAGETFTPLVLEVPAWLDLTKVKVRVGYDYADPALVTRTGTPPDYVYAYVYYVGNLRIWTKAGATARNGASISAATPGDYVPSGDYDASQLGLQGGTHTVTLYVEGIAPSGDVSSSRVFAQIDPDGDGPAGFMTADAVRMTCVKVDLDIDTDNDNGTAAPERDAIEDHVEDVSGDSNRPGKFVVVNDDDDDNDGIPDFADGYNRDGIAGNDDDATVGEAFTPIVLELPVPLDPTKAAVRLTFNASDPAGVTRAVAGTPPEYVYTPAPGEMRIWRKDGDEARNKNSVKEAAEPGDYVPPDTYDDLSKLGLSGSVRTITLYVEGIGKSTALADQQIKVEVDPDGDGPAGFMTADAVRLTDLQVSLAGVRVYDPKLDGAGSAEVRYEIDGPAAGFSPRLELTVVDGTTEVACLVRRTASSPPVGSEQTKAWNGKWGIKKDGTDTTHKGCYVDPLKYAMELVLYKDSSAGPAIIPARSYDICVVRLGVIEMRFEEADSAKDEEYALQYHLTKSTDTASGTGNDYPIIATGREHHWRIGPDVPKDPADKGDLDTKDGERRDEAPPHTEVSYPEQDTTDSGDVEDDSFNRPICYKVASQPQIRVRTGLQAVSHIPPAHNIVPCAYGTGTTCPPIKIEPTNYVDDPDSGAGDDNTNIQPGTEYVLEATAAGKLTDKVHKSTLTLNMKFHYQARTDTAGNPIWEEVPGEQIATHTLYTVFDVPKKPWDTRLPWVAVTDDAARWAGNTDDKDTAIGGIVDSAFSNAGHDYDGGEHHTTGFTDFDLTKLLLKTDPEADCRDMSNWVACLGSAVGLEMHTRRITGPFFTQYIDGIGSKKYTARVYASGTSYVGTTASTHDWVQTGWNYHQMPYYDSEWYDACAKYVTTGPASTNPDHYLNQNNCSSTEAAGWGLPYVPNGDFAPTASECAKAKALADMKTLLVYTDSTAGHVFTDTSSDEGTDREPVPK